MAHIKSQRFLLLFYFLSLTILRPFFNILQHSSPLVLLPSAHQGREPPVASWYLAKVFMTIDFAILQPQTSIYFIGVLCFRTTAGLYHLFFTSHLFGLLIFITVIVQKGQRFLRRSPQIAFRTIEVKESSRMVVPLLCRSTFFFLV